MEIEIEERECGDEELISMMRAQLEMLKSLLVDELDAEEAIENDKLYDKDMYYLSFSFLFSFWKLITFRFNVSFIESLATKKKKKKMSHRWRKRRKYPTTARFQVLCLALTPAQES